MNLAIVLLSALLGVGLSQLIQRIDGLTLRRFLLIRILLGCLLPYLFLIGFFWIYGQSLDLWLKMYDLNNAGIFSGVEITGEQQKIYQLVLNDSGRALIQMFSLPFFVCLSLLTEIFVHFYPRKKQPECILAKVIDK